MTKLERLWEQYPTSRPPTEQILRAGRRTAADGSDTTGRRRFAWMPRPVKVATALTALAGMFLAGMVVADQDGPGGPAGTGSAGGGTSGAGAAAAPHPVAFQADLQPADSCADLLATYRERGLERVTPWGWQPGRMLLHGIPTPSARDDAGTVMGKAETAQVEGQEASETGTNVQEIGVDEPDTVKTDGSLLVRLRGSELYVYDVSGEQTERLATLDLPRLGDGELLLAGDTVIALGADPTAPRDRVGSPTGYGDRDGSRVITVSIADPSSPEITDEVDYDSRLLSARQHDDVVRLVLSAGLPDLDFVSPEDGRTEESALRENRRLVKESGIEDWLPAYDAGDGERDLLDCRDVAVPPGEVGLDTVSIVGFTAQTPTEPDAIGMAGAASIAYESADHLYLASSPSVRWGCWDCTITGDLVRPMPAEADGTTYLFDFDLAGTSATHVASGEVEGTVADRWSMDSADDVLRVAVGPSSETGDANAVVTFRRDGQELVELGRVGGLGRNEDIKAVRWFDGLAVLVTFRRVDPLYAVDLTRPAAPVLLSELKIPGFSEYLHPLGPDRMVGVGAGPVGGGRWGAQLGLFDVSDLNDVRRLDVLGYPAGSRALAGLDPRTFTWLPEQNTVLTVVQRGRTGYLSELRVHPDGLEETKRTPVEYGTDIAQVRTIGLPDDRVVLVTGEEVQFYG